MSLVDAAADLIDALGETMTVIRVRSGTYDPTRGTQNKVLDERVAVTGVLTKSRQGQFGSGVIEYGRRIAVIKAKGLTFIPEVTDKIETSNGDEYQISMVMKVRESGDAVVYSCVVDE